MNESGDTALRGTHLARALVSSLLLAGCALDTAPPPAATHLLFVSQPATAVATQSLGSVSVAFLDSANNIVRSANGEVEVALATADTSAHLLRAARASAVRGVATFPNLGVDRTGEHRLVARSAGFDSALSAPFRIKVGDAGALAFLTTIAPTVAGVGLDTVMVAVTDLAGNVDSTSRVAVTLRMAIWPVQGTTTTYAVNGVAKFGDLVVTKSAATHTLVATAASLRPDTTTFTVTVAPLVRLTYDWPFEPEYKAGEAFHMQAVLTDQFGNTLDPVYCNVICASKYAPRVPATLSLGANPTGATLRSDFPLTRWPEHGWDWGWAPIIDTPGNGYTLVASAPGFKSDTTPPFNVVAK